MRDKIGVSDPKEVAQAVTRLAGDMIHLHGFVHADLHAGNMMVRRVPPPHPAAPAVAATVPSPAFAFAPHHHVPEASLTPLVTTEGADGARATVTTLVETWPADETNGAAPDTWQLVVLDHGMYSRLTPQFRAAYCRLWKALVTQDAALGRKATIELGLSAEEYDIFSLLLTFRPAQSNAALGGGIPQKEVEALKRRYGSVDAQDINDLMRRLPRDLMLVLRCSNMVRAMNKTLGGTSRDRFKALGRSAIKGLVLTDAMEDFSAQAEAYQREHGLEALVRRRQQQALEGTPSAAGGGAGAQSADPAAATEGKGDSKQDKLSALEVARRVAVRLAQRSRDAVALRTGQLLDGYGALSPVLAAALGVCHTDKGELTLTSRIALNAPSFLNQLQLGDINEPTESEVQMELEDARQKEATELSLKAVWRAVTEALTPARLWRKARLQAAYADLNLRLLLIDAALWAKSLTRPELVKPHKGERAHREAG
jgi:hypothetical protein